MMNRRALLLLRLGLAFVFVYAGASSLLRPQDWIGYFPHFLRQVFPENFLLTTFSIFEIALAMWLALGKKTFYAGIVSAVLLFGITITNLGILDITFRDFGLFFAALALITLSQRDR